MLAFANPPFSAANHPKVWDSFRGHFLDHLDDVNASLSMVGMMTIEQLPSPPTSPASTLVAGDDAVPAPDDLGQSE